MGHVPRYPSSATEASQKTAIINVRVFDGHRVGDLSTVVIDGDRIVSPSNAEGAHTVDAEGGTLIPGLIDSHCHVDTEAKLKALPTYGVTTALDMAESQSVVDTLEPLASKDWNCDYLSAGPAIVLTSHLPLVQPNSGSRSGCRRARVSRSQNVHSTFNSLTLNRYLDYIKLFADNFFDHQPEVSDMAAVVAEAHKVGKLTIAHATSRQGQQKAQDARVDFITHVPVDEALDDDFVKMMVAENRCAIPTLIMMKLIAERKGDKKEEVNNPDPTQPASRQTQPKKPDFSSSPASKSVTLVHSAGVPILAGDDHNTEPRVPAQPSLGHALHQELELLVQAGLSPVEALRAATVVPAGKFGLKDRGRITPGCRADLVLLKDDPTADIRRVGEIKRVWYNWVSWTPPLRGEKD